MKKKNKISSKIIKFFDKTVIIPITKIIDKISKKMDNPSKWLEKWLSKSNTLLFITLFLAIVCFIFIDQKIIGFKESSAVVLKGKTLDAVYNEESYVVEGLPKTVDITLIGSNADLYIAKQTPIPSVTVDLSGLKEGQHKVAIEYEQANNNVEYLVNPSIATVYIYPKVSDTRTVTVDILNQDSLNEKTIIESITYDTDKVVIKGAQYQLDKVASVKALVDINALPNKTAGTHTLNDVVLRAYDNEGNYVDVEIVPSKISVNVTISSPSKTVPVKIIPKGEVAFGKAISSIEQSVKEVTVYGTNEALAQLEYIPVEVTVDNITDKTEFKVELVKPTGVKSISSTSVNVTVNLGTASEKEIEGIKVDSINLAQGFSAEALTTNTVTVVVKGVSSIIDSLTAKDINVYIDLKGLGEGKHTVDLQVQGSDTKVQYSVKIKSIDINIFKS